MMAIEPRWEMVQRQREQSAQLLTQITVAEEKEAALHRDAERITRELEGVKIARGQLDTLREIGVRLGQGWHLGVPVHEEGLLIDPATFTFVGVIVISPGDDED